MLISLLQAAIFGGPVQHLPAEPEQPASMAHATSSDSDEQPQVVEIQEMIAFGEDVSTHNIRKSTLVEPPCLLLLSVLCTCDQQVAN